ncbi:hypothetical protein HAX54_038584 [Datura stramonium]|uniref:Integrator complex subunit 3 N-terminal domain-containing protein n=1 Tax=Datura stramonium TaxID=4076 RepID=A0ABS8SI29_DATST|nr:hypothetical protein [Datura stramonium]
MNIEPAILLMVNSIPKYIEVTHTLLEFLLIVVDNYDIERKEIIIEGVSTALSTLVKKGVVGSLDVLTRCNMISKVLREMLGNLLLVKQGIAKDCTNGHNIQCCSVPCYGFLRCDSGSTCCFPLLSSTTSTCALVYEIAKVPFDLIGHNHQIFHVLVIAAALAHSIATLAIMDWRRGLPP